MNIGNLDTIRDICSGCGACANVCPKDAIKMVDNSEGFLEPSVDESKCVNCNKCRSICPQITRSDFHMVKYAYAIIFNDEIRSLCSSGGAFGAISQWVINEGGAVFGVAYTEDFRRAEYIKATTVSELKKLYKSKYFQSDTATVYFEVKKALAESSNPVLFCGCPCQTDALKKYLKRDYDNLIIVDIMCHGVVSPQAYGKYLDEVFADVDSPIKDVDFRPQEAGWSCSNIAITAEDGTRRISTDNGSYFHAFLWGYSQRKSCFQCKYAQPRRVSDMTIGDFWGIDELFPEMNDKKGTSLVLCNTEKGVELLNKASVFVSKSKACDYKDVLKIAEKVNWAIVKPGVMPLSRDVFFYRLSKGDRFSQALKYASTGEFDVGIFGWWFEDDWTNYGSTLTYYALMEYVSSLGLTVCMITSPFHNKDKASKFVARHGYRMTPTYSFEDFDKHNKNINTFLIGSDQLWFYHCYKSWGHSLFLDFAASEKRKIAYAPSFAHSNPQIPDNEVPVLKKYLERFDEISVRESEGVKFLRDKFGVESVQNVDPVFLCSIKDWEDIACEAERKTQGAFLFTYILDPSKEKVKAIKYVSEQLELPVVSITDKQYETTVKEELLKDCGILIKASINELIYHLRHASFVITDSYHGTCFSLIFRKSFITVVNTNRGKSRFDTLDELFGISDRFVTDPTAITDHRALLDRVDYSTIVPRIDKAVKCSQAWLSNSLLKQKSAPPNPQNTVAEHESNKRVIFDLVLLNHLGYSIGRYLADNKIINISIYCSEKYLDIFEIFILSLQLDDCVTVNGYYSEKAFLFEHQQSINYGQVFFREGLPKKGILIFVSNEPTTFKAFGCTVLNMVNLLWKALRYATVFRPLLKFKHLHPKVHIVCVDYPLFPPEGRRNHRETEIKKNEKKYYFPEIKKNLPDTFAVLNKNYSHENWCELLDFPKSEISIEGKRVYFEYASTLKNIRDGHRITCFQPQNATKHIFMVGGCNIFGYGNADEDTSASFLQQLLNKDNVDIKVENYGTFISYRRKDLYQFLFDLPVKDDDIVVFGAWGKIPDLCAGCMDYIDLHELFFRPHEYSDVFLDSSHLSHLGQKVVAEKIYEYLKNKSFYEQEKVVLPSENIRIEPLNIFGVPREVLYFNERKVKSLKSTSVEELNSYIHSLVPLRKKTGAIVMNCNPFTFGHHYLVEYAARQCVHLYIFVVEEDRSIFKFEDRIRLVREGASDISNITIIPSGKFIISSLTFEDYFNKSELQDKKIDPATDITLFAEYIAPALGINARFAGEEPFDQITKQYNEAMSRILPKYEIEFIEIPRMKAHNEVISASQVRQLFEKGDFKQIAELVPLTTLEFLKKQYQEKAM